MGKEHITISVETQLMEKARKEGINVSSACEDGIINKLEIKELTNSEEYDLNLADAEPETYWIDKKDGKCKKRGTAMYFINEMGNVREVSKTIYLSRLQSMGKQLKESKEILPKDKKTFNHLNPDSIPEFS